MKIETIAPPDVFRPVVVTFETQAEVDALFGVLSYSPLLAVSGCRGLWKGLEPRKTPGYIETFNKVEKLLNR